MFLFKLVDKQQRDVVIREGPSSTSHNSKCLFLLKSPEAVWQGVALQLTFH